MTLDREDLIKRNINMERFTGPNFRGFKDYRKSFSVNISASL